MHRALASLLALALLALALLVGCSRAAAPEPPAAGPPTPAPETLALFEAAGADATVVVALRPDRWGAAVPLVRSLFAGSDVAPLVDKVLADDLPTTLTRAAATLLGGVTAPTVTGLDPSRPVVAGLFAPAVGDVALAARALVFRLPEGGVPGLRHRVLLPATDAATAAKGLSALVAGLGLAPDAGAPDGWTLFAVDEGFVALLAEKDRVRVEILTNDARTFPDAGARLAAYRAELLRPPKTAPLPRTPALLYAASRPDLAVVYLRPWQLRDLGSQLGALLVTRALRHVDPSYRSAIHAAGLAEISNGYLLLTPVGAETDDVALALDVRPEGLTLTTVTSLTEAGAAVYAAAAGGRLPPAPTGTLLAMWSRLDLPGALAAATPPPSFAAAASAREIGRAFEECGAACALSVPLRTPFGALRRLADLEPGLVAGRLPTGVALSIAGLGSDPREPRPNGGIAALFPANADTAWIARALGDVRAKLPIHLQPALRETTQGGAKEVVVSVGPADGAPFASTPVAAPDGALVGLDADLGGILRFLLAREDVPPILLRVGRLRAMAGVEGRALSSVAVLELAGGSGATSPATDLPALPQGLATGLAWESPGVAEATTKGARCLEDVTRTMRTGIVALAMAAPSEKAIAFAKAVDDARGPLACALAEADTKDVALRTRWLMADATAEQFLDGWQVDAAVATLRRACDEGHPEGCSRVEALAKDPPPALASVTLPCEGDGWVDRTAVVALRAEGPLPEAPAGDAPLVLAVAPDVSAERVAAASEALAGGASRRARLVVRGSDGMPRALVVSLGPDPKPAVAKPDASAPKQGISEAVAVGSRVADAAIVERRADGSVLVRDVYATETVVPAGTGEEWAAKLRELTRPPTGGLTPLPGRVPPPVHVLGAAGVRFEGLVDVVAALACGPREEAADVRLGPAPARPVFLKVLGDPRIGISAGVSGRLSGRGLGLFGASDAKALERALGEGGGLGMAGIGIETGAGGSGVGALGFRGTGGGGGGGEGGGFGRIHGLGSAEAKRPSGRAKSGTPEATPGLPREAIQRVVRANMNRVRYCYERSLAVHPDCAGTVRVTFTIGTDGAVTEASVASSTVTCPDVDTCIVTAARRWRFPQPSKGVVVVTYPFTFERSE